jgi:hypothetical protein
MNVTIPARAADLRAAYQRGFQDDKNRRHWPTSLEGPVCTDCGGDWLNIAVHPIDGRRDQVYLSGAV